MAHFAVPKSKGNPLDDFASKYNSDEDEDFDISEEELTSSDSETEPETDYCTDTSTDSETVMDLSHSDFENESYTSRDGTKWYSSTHSNSPDVPVKTPNLTEYSGGVESLSGTNLF